MGIALGQDMRFWSVMVITLDSDCNSPSPIPGIIDKIYVDILMLVCYVTIEYRQLSYIDTDGSRSPVRYMRHVPYTYIQTYICSLVS